MSLIEHIISLVISGADECILSFCLDLKFQRDSMLVSSLYFKPSFIFLALGQR